MRSRAVSSVAAQGMRGMPNTVPTCADSVSLSPIRSSCTATVSFSFTIGTAPSLHSQRHGQTQSRGLPQRRQLGSSGLNINTGLRHTNGRSTCTCGSLLGSASAHVCAPCAPETLGLPPHSAHRSSSSKVFFAQMYWLRLARLSSVSSTWAHFCGVPKARVPKGLPGASRRVHLEACQRRLDLLV